jgi:hypothetical protein
MTQTFSHFSELNARLRVKVEPRKHQLPRRTDSLAKTVGNFRDSDMYLLAMNVNTRKQFLNAK